MAQSYKNLKESFVSNLSGGHVSEINIVTAVAPVRSADSVFLRELTFAGSSPSLVGSPSSSGPLHQLWPSSVRD